MSLLLLFGGGGTPAPPVDAVGSGTFTVSASATGDVVVFAAGTATFSLSASGSPTAVTWIFAESWDSDESGKARVVFSAFGSASLLVPVVPPGAGSATTAIRRVSITMPAPVLDADGRPT